MNVNEIFPSNYLKAADLKGAQPRVTIASIQMETLGQGKDAQDRPVIYFEGKEKGLVANKTNMSTIAAVFGDETDDWTGAEIVLFETMVDFQGKTTPAIRVKIPAGSRRALMPGIQPTARMETAWRLRRGRHIAQGRLSSPAIPIPRLRLTTKRSAFSDSMSKPCSHSRQSR